MCFFKGEGPQAQPFGLEGLQGEDQEGRPERASAGPESALVHGAGKSQDRLPEGVWPLPASVWAIFGRGGTLAGMGEDTKVAQRVGECCKTCLHFLYWNGNSMGKKMVFNQRFLPFFLKHSPTVFYSCQIDFFIILPVSTISRVILANTVKRKCQFVNKNYTNFFSIPASIEIKFHSPLYKFQNVETVVQTVLMNWKNDLIINSVSLLSIIYAILCDIHISFVFEERKLHRGSSEKDNFFFFHIFISLLNALKELDFFIVLEIIVQKIIHPNWLDTFYYRRLVKSCVITDLVNSYLVGVIDLEAIIPLSVIFIFKTIM